MLYKQPVVLLNVLVRVLVILAIAASSLLIIAIFARFSGSFLAPFSFLFILTSWIPGLCRSRIVFIAICCRAGGCWWCSLGIWRRFTLVFKIGLIPAWAFQPETAGRDELLQFSFSTRRAIGQRCITELLNFFEFCPTGLTSIFIYRHVFHQKRRFIGFQNVAYCNSFEFYLALNNRLN